MQPGARLRLNVDGHRDGAAEHAARSLNALEDASGLGLAGPACYQECVVHEVDLDLTDLDAGELHLDDDFVVSLEQVDRRLPYRLPRRHRLKELAIEPLGTIEQVHRARFIRSWVGTSRGENGKTRVTFVWEPLPPVPMDRPFKMSVSGNGTIYIANNSGYIGAIYPDGGRGTITPAGKDKGTGNWLVDVAAGEDGYLYVTESTYGCVYKLADNGTVMARWDGCGPARFSTPFGVATDGIYFTRQREDGQWQLVRAGR